MIKIRTFIEKCQARVRGFTLLETMVAVTLLAVAIVAPMSLTAQSLASAYYARDEVTAYLAQEGLEAVRQVRDDNILQNSQGGTLVDLLNGIPINTSFRIDATNNNMTPCSADGGTCIPLKTDGTLYSYSGSTATQFSRTLIACYVHAGGVCDGNLLPSADEIKVTVTVSWQTAGIQKRTVNVSENLYRWVADGSASG